MYPLPAGRGYNQKEIQMSTNTTFSIEEDDIVRMNPDFELLERSVGWINVGAHAVRLSLTPFGDLTVETYPLGNETEPTGRITVSRDTALKNGATDSL